MGNDDEASGFGLAEEEESVLVVGVVRIVDGARQRVAKGSACFLEGYSVTPEVLGSLLGVPLESEAHAPILRRLRRLTDRH
jgi:hypothetical protein